MAHIIASPRGITLPYTSLFNVGLRDKSSRSVNSRPSEYFWKKAIDGDSLAETTPEAERAQESDDVWLDSLAPALSDSENETTPKANKIQTEPKSRKKIFTQIRRIAFKAFTPKSDGTGNRKNIVTSTEVITREETLDNFDQYGTTTSKVNKRMSVFNSWKFKSNGAQTQVQKMVAVLKNRISASSPADQQPKTWDEYHRFYANEQIDVLNPPLPPMEPDAEGDEPSAFHSRFYMAPRPANEQERQLVVNRLGVLGRKSYDETDEGVAKSKARIEIGDKLMEEGKAPTGLDEPWERRDSLVSEECSMGVDETRAMIDGVRSGQLPPETLEQHPVFRKIVKQCRELFGTALSMISILDDDRQIFLAESGLGGKRDISRDIGFCAHTILSGRKGFTVLDTHKDWRFENGPLTQNFGSRFYAGVPLMAPNLDGSQESEENACPIGTLCIVDTAPRESFSVEDRKKLVYMSEYARREIEKWFAKKMEQKMENLTRGQENWNHELKRVVSSTSDGEESLETEVLSDTPASPTKTKTSKRASLRRLTSSSSISTAPTSPASHTHTALKSPTKTGPGLFEDVNAVVKPKMRKVFDLATKLIGETLDLSLVYLTAVVPHGESNELGRTLIISGHNIPLPVPVFDAGLHLRALRAPEGGFLYQNPSVQESEEASLQPKGSGGTKPYASAMLLAVGTEAQPNSGGFVLAGYTDDPKRVFGAEDVGFMKQFSLELSRYTSRLQL
ncbi:hypothetical protein MJO29_000850 [Puccinia striiformis f. sp. tritici]|uniref:GAF domain-containing protein n=1 Tax=Puccinia striiformis f. sp. tritici PST-78 TaxID=1165861 RepID=A0A0L0VYA6_9BASI|nr:hypothetical protein MJO29_000850 [Puccinia striiformis f. sp. tritici]KNF04251.1 hypothetical protein PSTG_02598 [Puccinia striiformis f. sp. tritici PST-78]